MKYQILMVCDKTKRVQEEKLCDTEHEAMQRISSLEKIYPEYNFLIDETEQE